MLIPPTFLAVVFKMVLFCATRSAIYEKINVEMPALNIKAIFSNFSIPKDRLTEKVSMLANIAIIGKVFAGKSSFFSKAVIGAR